MPLRQVPALRREVAAGVSGTRLCADCAGQLVERLAEEAGTPCFVVLDVFLSKSIIYFRLSPPQFYVHFTVILDRASLSVEPYAEVDPESLSVSSQPELNLNNSTDRNRAPPVEKPKAPIDIRYGQLGVLQLRLRTIDAGVVLDELSGRFASAPQFFKRAAVCIDLLTVKPFPDLDALRAIMDAVRRAGMIPIGIAGEAVAVEPLAVAVNLPVLSSFRAPTRTIPVVEAAQSQPEPEPEVEASALQAAAVAPELHGGTSLLHTQMVRSGQRIYARQRDLIVNATVASGAEVMADGCVHVYGSLRGRAIAGAREGTSARIFCQEFNAELVSVAGVFRIFETIPPDLRGKPVQVWLDGESLHCTRIGA